MEVGRTTYHHRLCPDISNHKSAINSISMLSSCQISGNRHQALLLTRHDRRGGTYEEGESLLELRDLLLCERVGLGSVSVLNCMIVC